MKKIKSITASLLALAFLAPSLSLFACGDDTVQIPPAQNESVENSTLDEDITDETPKPVQPETPVQPAPPLVQKAQYIKCTGNGVNIRAGAGTSYSVLGSAESNTTYAVIEKTGNWYKTFYRNQTAYIYAEYASVFSLEKTDEEDIEAVISEGYKLLARAVV